MINDDDGPGYTADGDDFAYAETFTRFLCLINDDINPALAFPIVLDLLHDGLGDDNMAQYALQLLATNSPGTSKETH